jgi:hypothetical protein
VAIAIAIFAAAQLRRFLVSVDDDGALTVTQNHVHAQIQQQNEDTFSPEGP